MAATSDDDDDDDGECHHAAAEARGPGGGCCWNWSGYSGCSRFGLQQRAKVQCQRVSPPSPSLSVCRPVA